VPAAAREDDGPNFGAFVRRRGQDVLRFAYLLTGDQGAARALTVWSLTELGARWAPLLREYDDPEVAVRVLVTGRYLRGPALEPVPPALQPADPDVDDPSAVWGYGAGTDEVSSGWDDLRGRPAAERADLVLRQWAELDGETLDQALRPARRPPFAGLLASLRAQPPRARLRAALRRLEEYGDRDNDRVLIDARRGGPGPPSTWLLQQVFRYAERRAPELEPELLATIEARAETRRQQRRTSSRRLTAVTVAAVATMLALGALIRDPVPPPAAKAASPERSLTWYQAWPSSTVTRFVDQLRGGRDYRPLRFIDLRTAMGSTVSSTGESELFLVDVRARTARRLGLLNGPLDPLQTATDGLHVGWLVRYTTGPNAGAELWVADVAGGRSRLLATIPPPQLRERTPMLGMGAGRLYVVRTRGAESPGVEISSVPLTGGELRTELSLPGYIPVGWPWFSTIGSNSRQRVIVRNAVTGAIREGRLPDGSSFGACGRAWCIGAVPPGEQQRPGEVLIGQLDGSRRTRVVLAHIETGPLLPVLAGRFVLTRDSSGATFLHDLRDNQTVQMSGTVRHIVVSGRLIGWRIAGELGARWRIADLRQLP
jgi:hypothetical protein